MLSCWKLKLPINKSPSIIPKKEEQVQPETIEPCICRYIYYLWITNGGNFWMLLTYVDCKHAFGCK